MKMYIYKWKDAFKPENIEIGCKLVIKGDVNILEILVRKVGTSKVV